MVALAVILLHRSSPTGLRIGGLSMSGDEFILSTKGWSPAEIDRILADFSGIYGLEPGTFRAGTLDRDIVRIEALKPIDADRLLYLVNYLHYPRGFDLEGRDLRVAARFTLTEAMGAPTELQDRQATIYVPSGDTLFDEVYARVDPSSHFRVPFKNLNWIPVNAGREPRSLAELFPDDQR